MIESFREAARLNPMLAVAFAFALYVIAQITFIPLMISLVGLFSGLGMQTVVDMVGGEQLDLPQASSILRIVNAGNNIVSWGLPALFMAIFLGKASHQLSLDTKTTAVHLALAVLLIIAALPLVQSITFDSSNFSLPQSMADLEESLKAFETRANAQLMLLLGETSWGALIANIAVFAIIPAICEELFFRGFVQQKLGKVVGGHASIWITATIFSVMHFQFYGFFGRLFLGALLGYLLYRSGSLWPSILAHFTYNIINVIFGWGVFKYGWADQEMLEQTAQIPTATLLGSIVVFGGLFYLFYRKK